MKGRKPKPKAMKILAGNPGHRRLNSNEPDPPSDLPICPEWLDDEAKREWNCIVPDLHRMGLLSAIDRAALAAYCQSFADLKDAVETLAKEGKTTRTEKGYLIQHPAVAQKNKAMLLMSKFLEQFGLSPSSRSRLKTNDAEKQDEFEAFMRAG